jgi:Protein of unknown function (DUF3667)
VILFLNPLKGTFYRVYQQIGLNKYGALTPQKCKRMHAPHYCTRAHFASEKKNEGVPYFVLIFKQKLTVSHIPQRKEKDCLNCGTIVQGHYCHHCGQENVVPHETFWHMVKHFLYDITHFDSKFFDSMKFLLLRPGFLPLEYIKGKRASYLNPIKKYVFTSAVFFIVFFAVLNTKEAVDMNLESPLPAADRAAYIQKGEAELVKNPANDKWRTALLMLKDTARVITQKDMIDYWEDFNFINLSSRNYQSKKEYDSVQKNLPSGERDNMLVRAIQYQNLKLKERYKNDPQAGTSKLVEVFLHKLPYLLFFSLPLFALVLKLLYIRRKNYYYADHGIFSIYHYIFSFLLLLVVLGFDKLSNIAASVFFEIVTLIIFLYGGVYLYLSMKRFYGQGYWKTFLKFLLLNIAGLLILLLLLIAFLLLTVFLI